MDVHDQRQLKKSRVVRVNSEELWDFFITQAANQGCPGVALKMEIKAMPTFLMMKGGGSTDKLVGANPYAIKKMLK
ncbi:hypothetical protein PRUPE_4G201400 [Prunus persica]|uniref:Thioredoxin domain-containing protein n=1 Tax=Prunus persica TaxID=3760 RepID=A0A251PNF1_PRUPE|nr:thioredoxin-like protein CXXS1 [Prunus persica]ONI13084.1 hypothetical protein PRUPE_4G201400 [Prunus persica]